MLAWLATYMVALSLLPDSICSKNVLNDSDEGILEAHLTLIALTLVLRCCLPNFWLPIQIPLHLGSILEIIDSLTEEASVEDHLLFRAAWRQKTPSHIFYV